MARDLDDAVRRAAREQFSRSGGPGGQNVNKVNTRVTLHVPLAELDLDEAEIDRVRRRLANRVNAQDELVVTSAETRSQHRNRELALLRSVALLRDALRPGKQRRPTRPGRAARDRRLEGKRQKGTTKRLRRPPEE
jgi:ribosome-associated protein